MATIASSSSNFLLKRRDIKRDKTAIIHYDRLRFVKNRSMASSGHVLHTNICSSKIKQRSIKVMAAVTTTTSPKREKDPQKRVVITGMGLVSVFGNDVDTFYNSLLEGKSGISLIDRFDVSNLPVKIGGQIRGFSSEGYIDQKHGRRLDDCWRYCLVAGRRAFEDANLVPEVLKHIDKSDIGVIVGSGLGGVTTFNDAAGAYDKGGLIKISPTLVPYTAVNTGSALLGIELGAMGPNYSIATSCATSNHCFHAAANTIRRGEAQIIVAGGTEAGLVNHGLAGFIACKALSTRNSQPKQASRPWDRNRDGFVLSEGAAVLVMESLEHANKRGARIIAEYLGGGINCDAHHITAPRADGLGVSTCIRKGLEDAGVSPEEVNYINAHATSTIMGDLAELNAINQVFKNTSEIKMNGTKSMIGHSLSAAGGFEAIATIKAITTGWIHPTINQYDLEPEVTIDTVPNVKKKHEVHIGISNSFGFGGQNSVAVFAPFMP